MCLLNKIKDLDNESGIGYKVYNKINNKLYSEYFTLNGESNVYSINTAVKIGSTYTAVNKKIKLAHTLLGTYLTGFHIFTNLIDANKWASIAYNQVVVMVEYSKARLYGQDSSNSIVIIADEIKIIKEI